ncbi:MAG TPA: DinB family protein [Mycobacteriales bacterium]|nr:DinB family protein [Mycobacteriales bacterium]
MEVAEALEVLSRTPGALRALLGGLPDAWLRCGGADDWGPAEVLAHLVEGELTDWLPRLRTILAHGTERAFAPFDRTTVPAVGGDPLERFAGLRAANVAAVRDLGPLDLDARGVHPELGEVTLGELLATWAVHDLAHVAQVAEAMARSRRDEVGPWRAYLPVLDRGPATD